MARSQYHYLQRRQKTKQTLQAVAWIQMVSNAIIVCILLHSWFLMETEHEETILEEFMATYYSPLFDCKTYEAEKFDLTPIALTSFTGLLTGFALLEGARRGISLNLKLWLVHAFVFVGMDLAVHTFFTWPSIALFCRIIVTTTFYCFGTSQVVFYLKDLSLICDQLALTLPTTVTPSVRTEKGEMIAPMPTLAVEMPTVAGRAA